MQKMNQFISIAKPSDFRASNDQIINEKKTYDLARLRQEIAVADGYDKRLYMPLGVDSLDQALAGGLTLGRVHLLMGAMQVHGAVSGFAMALLDLLQHHAQQIKSKQASNWQTPAINDAGLIIWCPVSQRNGAGMLYGHGLAAAGLDPARLLIVDTPNPSRRLAALDDILRTEGLAAVVMEYDGVQKSADYWMRFARRTQLAAEASMTTGFLLGWPRAASGFESLWHVAPAPDDSSLADTTWNSVWDVDLKQVRGGRPYNLRLVWDPIDNQLAELPVRRNQLVSSQPTLSQLTLGESAKSSAHAKPTIADAGRSHSGTSHPGQQARRTA